MKNLNLLLIYSLLVVGFFSCKKKDEVEPLPETKVKTTHYMPLAIGNTWDYFSEAYGEYTVSVTGTETKKGTEYFVLKNSQGSKSHMVYKGNKCYGISTANNKTYEILLIDEDASVGDIWRAAVIDQSYPGTYTFLTYYDAQLVEHYDTYSVGDKTYTDVIEVNLETSIYFSFDPSYTAGMDPETIEYMEEYYLNLFSGYSINQRTFYSKGVGFVYQYSDDYPELGAELLKYSVVN